MLDLETIEDVICNAVIELEIEYKAADKYRKAELQAYKRDVLASGSFNANSSPVDVINRLIEIKAVSAAF